MKLQRENLKGKNVLVFGSGISGMGAVKLLAEVEAQILLYDGNEKLKEEEVSVAINSVQSSQTTNRPLNCSRLMRPPRRQSPTPAASLVDS